MKKFESKIAGIIKENVTFANKAELRTKILEQHVFKTPLENSLIQAVSSVKLSVNARVLMKEKLFMLVEATSSSRLFRLFDNTLFRRSMGFATFLLFAFGLILQPFSAVQTVKAYTPTKISIFSGNVTVERSGEQLQATNDFILQENDIVQSGPGGFAEIIFADDSIARLSNSTRLVVSSFDNKVINSTTELNLVSGELWVNTLGLAGSQASFTVNAGELTTNLSTNAVFDLEVNQNFVRVVALEDSLNLNLLNNGAYVPAVLKKGELVKVKKETPYTTFLDQVAFEERMSDFNLDWIVSNYKQDEFYLESLSKTRIIDLKKRAGITPDSYFYPVKELQRAARLAFTFNPIKSAELEIMYANQKLLEAEVLLNKGKTDTAKKVLNDYSRNLTKVAEKVAALDSKDNAEQEDLKKLKETLVASVSIPKRDLSQILPNQEKYQVKEALKEAEVIVAETAIDKKKVQLIQANQLLEESKLLAESKQNDLAISKLEVYLKEIERLSAEFQSLSDEEKSLIMPTLIESNIKGLSLLDSLKTQVVVVAEGEPLVPVVENDTTNFDSKLVEVTNVSKDNLNSTLIEANKIKTPLVLDQINKINNTVDLNTISNSSATVIVEEVKLPTTTTTLPIVDSSTSGASTLKLVK